MSLGCTDNATGLDSGGELGTSGALVLHHHHHSYPTFSQGDQNKLNTDELWMKIKGSVADIKEMDAQFYEQLGDIRSQKADLQSRNRNIQEKLEQIDQRIWRCRQSLNLVLDKEKWPPNTNSPRDPADHCRNQYNGSARPVSRSDSRRTEMETSKMASFPSRPSEDLQRAISSHSRPVILPAPHIPRPPRELATGPSEQHLSKTRVKTVPELLMEVAVDRERMDRERAKQKSATPSSSDDPPSTGTLYWRGSNAPISTHSPLCDSSDSNDACGTNRAGPSSSVIAAASALERWRMPSHESSASHVTRPQPKLDESRTPASRTAVSRRPETVSGQDRPRLKPSVVMGTRLVPGELSDSGRTEKDSQFLSDYLVQTLTSQTTTRPDSPSSPHVKSVSEILARVAQAQKSYSRSAGGWCSQEATDHSQELRNTSRRDTWGRSVSARTCSSPSSKPAPYIFPYGATVKGGQRQGRSLSPRDREPQPSDTKAREAHRRREQSQPPVSRQKNRHKGCGEGEADTVSMRKKTLSKLKRLWNMIK